VYVYALALSGSGQADSRDRRHVPKQLGLEQRLGDASTIERHEAPGGSLGAVVTRHAFTADENRIVRAHRGVLLSKVPATVELSRVARQTTRYARHCCNR
jgi:hypothetical protein